MRRSEPAAVADCPARRRRPRADRGRRGPQWAGICPTVGKPDSGVQRWAQLSWAYGPDLITPAESEGRGRRVRAGQSPAPGTGRGPGDPQAGWHRAVAGPDRAPGAVLRSAAAVVPEPARGRPRGLPYAPGEGAAWTAGPRRAHPRAGHPGRPARGAAHPIRHRRWRGVQPDRLTR